MTPQNTYTASKLTPSRAWSPGKLPEWLIAQLDNPPHAGGGVHRWLFTTARQLAAHYASEHIEAILTAAVRACGRSVPLREVHEAVLAASACAWRPAAGSSRPMPCGAALPPRESLRRWPMIDVEARRAAAACGALVDLWEASPWRVEGNNAPDAEQIVDALFPGDPLLCCCGAEPHEFDTRLRSEWRGKLNELTFIVPSPMTARSGRRKSDGQLSTHTLDNTGPRRFLVIEQDQGKLDEQAGVLLHLAQFAPLAVAVFSGGKSLHGWFYSSGQPEKRLRGFMERAVALGADPATWVPSQFVRLPNGTRGDGKRQSVYFLRPEVAL